MARLRQNFLSGVIEGGLTAGDTVLSSSSLQNALPVLSGDVLAIVLDPQGTAGDPEVAWIIAHGMTLATATIRRGQEGTTARAHAAGVRWAHGPTTGDLTPAAEAATESSLRRLLNLLNLARTPGDVLRVQMDGGSGNMAVRWANHGTYSTYYQTDGAPTSMDAREQQKTAQRLLAQQARQTRWTY
jgi:hypothetical protein